LGFGGCWFAVLQTVAAAGRGRVEALVAVIIFRWGMHSRPVGWIIKVWGSATSAEHRSVLGRRL